MRARQAKPQVRRFNAAGPATCVYKRWSPRGERGDGEVVRRGLVGHGEAGQASASPRTTVTREELEGLQPLEEFLALVVTETLETTGLADTDVGHQSTGLDLPETREGLEHGDHLHLPHRLVSRGLIKQFLQRQGP